MTERSNNFKSNRAINLKFKFFSIQFDYIVWIFNFFSIQFECLVWIFNFFQFNLNILFEFSIFFNSIWMSCLNFQFFSIQFEHFVWNVNFYQFKRCLPIFFQIDFLKIVVPIKVKQNWIGWNWSQFSPFQIIWAAQTMWQWKGEQNKSGLSWLSCSLATKLWGLLESWNTHTL